MIVRQAMVRALAPSVTLHPDQGTTLTDLDCCYRGEVYVPTQSGILVRVVQRTFLHIYNTGVVILMAVSLAGCGGSKLLDDPQPLVLERPLTTTSDQRLEAHLDWVIIRGGLGTWVENANWDEYLLRVRNLSDEPVRITGVTVYDSLDTRLQSSANINNLVSMSRKTTRRYKAEGLKVKAGVGGETLMAAGTVALVGSQAYTIAVVTGSAAGSAAGVAVGAVVLAPVLIVGGMVQSKNKDWVARELVSRHTPLPVDLAPQQLRSLNFFFPLAPSPNQIELVYNDSRGEHRLIVDTRELLHGLHIRSTEE